MSVIRRVFDAEGFMVLAESVNSAFDEDDKTRPPAPTKRQYSLRKTTSNPTRGSMAWRVKNAREQMGMTQTALARSAGVDRTLIVTWELEMRLTHRFEDVLKVAEALDVSLEYMAGLTEEFGSFPVPQQDVRSFA